MTDKLQPSPPMAIEFKEMTLQPQERNIYWEVDSPDRGRIRVEISNYTDQPKTFKISVSEDTSGL